MKIFLLLISLIFLFPGLLAAGYRDPFESVLPKEEPRAARREPERRELPDWVVVEGVIWGSERPQVIISGQVYSVGDSIRNLDAAVTEIKKNVVFIAYDDRVFRRTTRRGK